MLEDHMQSLAGITSYILGMVQASKGQGQG